MNYYYLQHSTSTVFYGSNPITETSDIEFLGKTDNRLIKMAASGFLRTKKKKLSGYTVKPIEVLTS